MVVTEAIDIWLVPRGKVSPAQLAPWLTSEDLARADGVASASRREELLLGRALLRACLAQHLGVPALDLCFIRDGNDKPALAMPDGPAFNLSHGPRWIGCAVAPVAHLGIDIDSEQRKNRIDDIAQEYFHADEQQWLAQAAEDAQRRSRFFAHWTLKEAHIKALGETLTGARLRDYAFDTRSEPPQAAFDASGQWHWQHWRFDGSEHLSIACCLGYTQTLLPCRLWRWDGQTAVRMDL